MRATLPAYLIHFILLLSADASNIEPLPETPATTAAPSAPSTLWDLGFSLQAKWSDLRELEECPVPPDLICVAGGSCGDQTVMEQVAASIRPSESTGNRGPVETQKVELEEDLVSFEDWKRRKMEEDGDEDVVDSSSVDSTQAETSSSAPSSGSSGLVQADNKTDSNNNTKSPNNTGKNDTKPSSKAANDADTPVPISKPPVHNKYNYASPDCSARIHSSSRLTQHASSILHKSRDRYMLTPCKADEHWVVVELCDEIRIEAVEIAVWEFFSGVVREVKVSVGGAEEDEERDGEDLSVASNTWEDVGTFIGKNVRGVQTFTLPKATSFQRFIRLDFPSYFGTEYYCPVSQVKVYGMNQMEAFKSEQKRLAATANHRDKEKITKEKEAEERKQREKVENDDRERQKVKQEDEKREKELDELERLVLQQAGRQGSVVPEMTSFPTIEVVTVTAPSSATPSPSTVVNATIETIVADQNKTTTSTSSSSRVASPRSDSSESIYAHIIRRLNALEGNSSLVARYIEEQAKVMRHMLSRVEKGWDDWQVEREMDELSRWEQERMRQEDRLGKVISQMELQRLAMDSERRAVLSELRVLSSELGYERRRGIAQLLITLVIIVLGVVSRSSTIDAVLKPLVAEAKRRKSFYSHSHNSMSGPLSGLQIDMGSDRPPAVIGFPPPRTKSHTELSGMPSSIRHQRSNSVKRPSTPRRRHNTGPVGNSMRIFSDSTPHLAALHTPPNAQDTGSPFAFNTPNAHVNGNTNTNMNTTPNFRSPKPRISLPASRMVNSQRKLARSAHLHPMEADKVRRQMKSPTYSTGELTPRRVDVSPSTAEEGVFSDGMEVEMLDDLDTRSDWGTDAGGSVSEIDTDLRVDGRRLSPAGKLALEPPIVTEKR